MQQSDEVKHLKAALETLTERVNNQFHHLSDKVKHSAKQGEEKLKTAIEDKPFQAVGIALAVGVLIGVLLKK